MTGYTTGDDNNDKLVAGCLVDAGNLPSFSDNRTNDPYHRQLNIDVDKWDKLTLKLGECKLRVTK